MSDEATTQAASAGDTITENPELAKLEQAVQAEAVSQDSPAQEPEAPFGQAFQELAEKKGFSNPDDLVKAYQNLESQSTKSSQELRELAKEIRSIKTPQEQADPLKDVPDEQRQALDLLGKVIDERLEKRLQPLKQNLEVQEAQKEINAVKAEFPSVSDSDLQQAIDVVDRHPSLSLSEAVKIITYENAAKVQTKQVAKTAKTQEKKRAFVESAGASKSSGSIDYSSLSLEELENILPKSGQFIDYAGKLRK